MAMTKQVAAIKPGRQRLTFLCFTCLSNIIVAMSNPITLAVARVY